MAIEKINGYMQKLEMVKKIFDLLPHFTLHRVLSQISPQFYSKDELTEIEKVTQILCQQTNLPLISQSKVEGVEVSNLKRCRSSNEGGNMFNGERRVKPKLVVKKKPNNHKKEILSSPPPELPNHINNLINVLDGTDIKYIMCKTLFSTDLSSYHNRLSMPISQIKSDFLTEIEKATLETRDQEGKPSCLKVVVLDSDFNEFSLSLKKWNMTSCITYNLVQDWTDVLSKNNFKDYQKIDIWSFRVNGKLYFILDTNEPEEIEKSGKQNNSIVISKTEDKRRSQRMKTANSRWKDFE
ncbi:unnamed protein product [Lathyrus sativus]|nr:unnamed protein product [Lathyrus sativus]